MPPELRRVQWPPHVRPLGTFLSLEKQLFTRATVILRLEEGGQATDPATGEPYFPLREVWQALAAGLPRVKDYSVYSIFDVYPSLFRLNDRLLLSALTDEQGFLCLNLLDAAGYARALGADLLPQRGRWVVGAQYIHLDFAQELKGQQRP